MKDNRNSREDSEASERARYAPTRNGSPPPLLSDVEQARVEERLLYLAQRRYGFCDGVAKDLAQATMESYLEALTRYDASVDHHKLLIGTLRGKCREHIRRQICLTAQGNAIRDVMKEIDVPAALAAGALDDIASRDARKLILEALRELRPKALGALQVVRAEATRIDLLDVIQRLGIDNQADAASLRAYRTQFRRILASCGIRL